MPMNQYVAPFQQSGSPNVPITESTAANYQGWPFNAEDSMGPDTSGQSIVFQVVNANFSGGVVFSLQNSGAGGLPPTTGTAPGVSFQSGVTTSVLLSGSAGGGGVSNIAGISVSGVQPTGLAIQGVVANSGIGLSGFFGQGAATIFTSGFVTYSAVAANSGVFAPVGMFLIQVLGISGNPYVKIPFFNS